MTIFTAKVRIELVPIGCSEMICYHPGHSKNTTSPAIHGRSNSVMSVFVTKCFSKSKNSKDFGV